jgi:hypothetical protein
MEGNMNKKSKASLRRNRTIHLIDIENLCLNSNPTLKQVQQVRSEYFEFVKPGPSDLFYVTVSSKNNVQSAVFGWPNAWHGCKEGHDGADILLAKAMLEDDLESRFDGVVIASGDGGLAPFVQSLVSKFKAVLVVSQPSAIALLMARSGGSVRYLRSEFALVA